MPTYKAHLSEEPPVQDAVSRRPRLYFVDNLRVALAVLVVLHHVAITYGAVVVPFYYTEPPFVAPGVVDPLAFLLLIVFSLLNQGWFMGAFFLLAGYFVPASFDRRGPGAFIKGRLVRLGIPLVVFYFVINPLSCVGLWLMPPELTGITTPYNWQSYLDCLGMGPLWFAAMLLVFSLGYVAWRVLAGTRQPSEDTPPWKPSWLGIGAFCLALALVSYLVRIVIPAGQEVWDFPTLGYLPQYLSLFVIGIVASRRDGFRAVPDAMGLAGFIMAVVATVLLFPLAFSGQWFSLELTPELGTAMGGGHWRSAVYALWDALFSVGLCLGAITFSRRVLSRQRRLGRLLSRLSYTVYIIHIPVIVALAYALRGLWMPPLMKFGLAAIVMVPASFAVAYLVLRIPLVARVLGSSTRRDKESSNADTERTGDQPATARREGESEIVIAGLTKRFGDVVAVDDLSLNIKRGELFGLLGPNGAGKTTTISILCGLLEPSAGTVHIGGLDAALDMPRIKERIGVCPQEAAVYKFLTGRENIELFASLSGMDPRAARARARELLGQTDFAESAGRRAKGYSGGMMRQLNLLMALVSDPEIVFLDEPTVGMDARARRRTWEYIGALRDQNKTIILTTHYIEEAQALSDRVGIIDYGRLVALGAPQELMRAHDCDDLEQVFMQITGRRIAEGS